MRIQFYFNYFPSSDGRMVGFDVTVGVMLPLPSHSNIFISILPNYVLVCH